MNEEQQKLLQALDILINAVEYAQSTGIYSIADSAHIYAAIKYFKSDYSEEKQENEEVGESPPA